MGSHNADTVVVMFFAGFVAGFLAAVVFLIFVFILEIRQWL